MSESQVVEKDFYLKNANIAPALFGINDSYLKLLEESKNVTINPFGDYIKISGNQEDVIETQEILSELVKLLNQGINLSEADIVSAVKKKKKGTLERTVNDNISIKLENGVIVVARPNDEKENRSLHGLTRTLINNMIEGVSNEFSKQLEINGVGYRAAKQGNKIVLTLGYSHPVEMVEPEGITYEVPNPNSIIVKGIDKELVGQMAAEIRSKRPPEVYRGKGIKYVDEHIRRKEGKTGK